MEQHGGRIGVHSDGLGLGSTFFIEIPLVLSEEELERGRHGSAHYIENEKKDRNVNCEHKSLTSSFFHLSRCAFFSPYSVSSIKPVPDSNKSRVEDVEKNLSPAVAETESVGVRQFVDSTIEATPRKITALIVDDSYLNRRMIARLLQQRSFVIFEACDGAEAVDCVSKNMRSLAGEHPTLSYDVILMDFVMPIMDGPTATKQIRALGYRGVIIGVTGNALPDDISTFLASGADVVMTKPINIESFIQHYHGKHMLCKM